MSRHDIETMKPEKAAKHLLNLLAPLGAAVVRYEYSGSGDSLEQDAIVAYRTLEDFDKKEPIDKDKFMIDSTLAEALTEWAFGRVEAHHGGWENNEGGYGYVDFIVQPAEGEDPRVVQNHWDYVQSEQHGGEHVY